MNLQHAPSEKIKCSYDLEYDESLICKSGTCDLNKNFIIPFFSNDGIIIQALPIFVIPNFASYDIDFTYKIPPDY